MKYWPSLSSWHHGFCHRLGGIHILCITEEAGLLIQPPASTGLEVCRAFCTLSPSVSAEIKGGLQTWGSWAFVCLALSRSSPTAVIKTQAGFREEEMEAQRDYVTASRLGRKSAAGAKNRTEVLGFCTSTTRPFLSSSQIVSPMTSLPQWLARKVLHYADQLLSGAGWRPNTSPQMFSQPPKIDLRAAHGDCNRDYFLKKRYIKENVCSN